MSEIESKKSKRPVDTEGVDNPEAEQALVTKNAQQDRIALSLRATERLDAWVKQVQASRPGVDLSRRDLLEWLIMERPERLTPSEERGLGETYYDELKFLHFAIRELKAAKSRGESLSLQDFVGQLPTLARGKAKVRAGGKNKAEANDPIEIEAQGVSALVADPVHDDAESS